MAIRNDLRIATEEVAKEIADTVLERPAGKRIIEVPMFDRDANYRFKPFGADQLVLEWRKILRKRDEPIITSEKDVYSALVMCFNSKVPGVKVSLSVPEPWRNGWFIATFEKIEEQTGGE